MTKDEVKLAVAEAMADYDAGKIHHQVCRYTISPEEHQRQHDALNRLIDTLDKVDKIRWSVVKYLVISAVIFILALFGLGDKIRSLLVG